MAVQLVCHTWSYLVLTQHLRLSLSSLLTAGEDFVMLRKFFNISRPNIQPDQAFEAVLPDTTVSPPFVIDIIDDSILERVECFICEIVDTSHPGVQIGMEKTISCCVTDEDGEESVCVCGCLGVSVGVSVCMCVESE